MCDIQSWAKMRRMCDMTQKIVRLSYKLSQAVQKRWLVLFCYFLLLNNLDFSKATDMISDIYWAKTAIYAVAVIPHGEKKARITGQPTHSLSTLEDNFLDVLHEFLLPDLQLQHDGT